MVVDDSLHRLGCAHLFGNNYIIAILECVKSLGKEGQRHCCNNYKGSIQIHGFTIYNVKICHFKKYCTGNCAFHSVCRKCWTKKHKPLKKGISL